MSGLSTTILKEIVFLLPPIDMQKEYLAKVKAIENEMAIMENSIGQLETLFSSLQKRAFKGEL